MVVARPPRALIAGPASCSIIDRNCANPLESRPLPRASIIPCTACMPVWASGISLGSSSLTSPSAWPMMFATGSVNRPESFFHSASTFLISPTTA